MGASRFVLLRRYCLACGLRSAFATTDSSWPPILVPVENLTPEVTPQAPDVTTDDSSDAHEDSEIVPINSAVVTETVHSAEIEIIEGSADMPMFLPETGGVPVRGNLSLLVLPLLGLGLVGAGAAVRKYPVILERKCAMTIQEAFAYFAAEGRLVDPDPEAPIILVNGSEMLVSPAQLVTAAAMMARRGVQLGPVSAQEIPVLVPKVALGTVLDENLVLDDEVLYTELRKALRVEVPVVKPGEVSAGYEVCEKHAAQLAGWVEAFCPFCDADSTAGSEAGADNHIQESEGIQMTFHTCSDGRYKIAAKDGFCKNCRPAAPRWTNRAEMVEAIRQSRDIVLCWVDEGQMRLVIGPNTTENRLVAATIQSLKKHEEAEELVVRIGAGPAASLLAAKGLTFKLVVAR